MSDNIEDATVIESKPLPQVSWADSLMMTGSFFAGYFLGKQNRRKATGNRQKAVSKRKK